MRRVLRLVATPFGVASLACLALAGWALWSGGILDGPVARQARTSSVYAAPGTGLDVAAAERVIGNRRLIVLLLAEGDTPSNGCDELGSAADGTLVLSLAKNGDEYDKYGCSRLPGAYDTPESLGHALVAETTIADGVNQFPDRPLDALKVIVVNYDRLVKAGLVPQDARTISPSLPRYVIAAAAVLAVLAGSLLIWLSGRRAGRLTARLRDRLTAAGDARTLLSAATAVLAQQLLAMDTTYRTAGGAFRREYRDLTADYLAVLDDLPAAAGVLDTAAAGLSAAVGIGAGPDTAKIRELTTRVEDLSARARRLAAKNPNPPREQKRTRTR